MVSYSSYCDFFLKVSSYGPISKLFVRKSPDAKLFRFSRATLFLQDDVKLAMEIEAKWRDSQRFEVQIVSPPPI